MTLTQGNGAGGSAAERELAVHRRLMRFGEAESVVAPIWSQSATSVPEIEAHLARLWTNAGGEGGAIVTEKGMPHARASVLNLIVTVPDAEAAERVVGTMLGLGFRHPSRAIVLVANPQGSGASLDASISAHCHPTGANGDQVCYEEVVLTIRGETAQHLNGVVAPLLIHDLPTHVWWPGDPPFRDPTFDQLVELGDRIVIDSSDFSDLLLGLRRLGSLQRRSDVGDLAWKRLGWWQELTAQFFDAPRFRRYLPNLNRVVVRYAAEGSGTALDHRQGPDSAPGVAAPEAGAMLFAGWIASRLDWKRHGVREQAQGEAALVLEGRYEMVDLRVIGDVVDDVPPGDLVSVRLQARGETGAAEFIIDRSGNEATVASNADGMTAQLRRMRMDTPSEPELLAASLVSDGHDEVYQTALRTAATYIAAMRLGEKSA